MTAKEKKQTSDALTEKSTWIRVGLLPIHVRPLTLGQIFEIGAYVNDINADGLELRVYQDALAQMFTRHANAPLMQEIFLCVAFRSSWKRRLFGWYIRKRLTMGCFHKLMEYMATSFTANFFLTSIIFLRQTKTLTEPRQTTARGQQLEE